MLHLVDASFELLDAAISDIARLGVLLGATVAAGWEGFPEALPALRTSSLSASGGWGSLLFVMDPPRTLVGLGGYKGGPTSEGVLEIGYAIAPGFRGRGLATEAVRLMVTRGFAEPRVQCIDAHTLAQVNPSTRVLERTGFERIGEIEDPDEGAIWHWRRRRTG